MSDDDQRPLFNRPAAHLLDELESIRGSLTEGLDADDSNALVDIPLLDDMVIHNLNSNASLLNISQIFDDHLDEDNQAEATAPEEKTSASVLQSSSMQFPRFTLDVAISDDLEIAEESLFTKITEAPPVVAQQTAQPQRIRPDYSREVLIQELVDEFIPQIEAELHARLRQLDDTALRRLKDSK